MKDSTVFLLLGLGTAAVLLATEKPAIEQYLESTFPSLEPYISSTDQTVAQVVASVAGEPRGYRNNNPGNLKPAPGTYQGQIGLDLGGFAIFDTPANGLRALMLNAQYQFQHHADDTLNKLGAVWAPLSDNNPADYGQRLANQIFGYGASADSYFNPSSAFGALAQAIAVNENGYWKSDYDTALAAAQGNAMAYLGLA